jgi:hypothetical protein
MKNLLYITLLALPLLLVPSRAHAGGCCVGPATLDFGFSWHYNFKCGSKCQAGPWYTYWPYEAHFAAAAPVGGPCYPGWPGAGAMGSMGAPAGPMGGHPVAQPMTPMPSTPSIPSTAGLQPTGYSAQVPAYWYGR